MGDISQDTLFASSAADMQRQVSTELKIPRPAVHGGLSETNPPRPSQPVAVTDAEPMLRQPSWQTPQFAASPTRALHAAGAETAEDNAMLATDAQMATYIGRMRRPETFAGVLEAQALGSAHRIVLKFWTPDSADGSRYAYHSATNGEDGWPVYNVCYRERDLHFVPLVNVEEIRTSHDDSPNSTNSSRNLQCSGQQYDVGGRGSCLFLTAAYFLERERTQPPTPIMDLAKLVHDAGTVPIAARQLRADPDACAVVAGLGKDPNMLNDGDLLATLRAFHAQPYRDHACDAILQDPEARQNIWLASQTYD